MYLEQVEHEKGCSAKCLHVGKTPHPARPPIESLRRTRERHMRRATSKSMVPHATLGSGVDCSPLDCLAARSRSLLVPLLALLVFLSLQELLANSASQGDSSVASEFLMPFVKRYGLPDLDQVRSLRHQRPCAILARDSYPTYPPLTAIICSSPP